MPQVPESGSITIIWGTEHDSAVTNTLAGTLRESVRGGRGHSPQRESKLPEGERRQGYALENDVNVMRFDFSPPYADTKV